MTRALWALVLLVFITGCSPGNRLQRIIKRNPQLIHSLEKDTTILDTVTVPVSYFDTVILTSKIDTIIFTHAADSFYILRNSDTFNIHHHYRGQTIVSPVQVKEKTKVITLPAEVNWTKIARWIALAIIAICGTFLGAKVLKKASISGWI